MCWGVEVTQEKMILVSLGEELVVIPCEHNDNTYLTMLWYQQKNGQGLKLLTYSVGKDSNDIEDKDNPNKWAATERPEVLKYYLKIAKPEVGDSAVYFCAASTQPHRADGALGKKLQREHYPIPPTGGAHMQFLF